MPTLANGNRQRYAGILPTEVHRTKFIGRVGADVTIPLVEDAVTLESAFKGQFAAGADIVIDYLWGQSAERRLIAGAKA